MPQRPIHIQYIRWAENALLTDSWWIILIPGIFLVTLLMCLSNIGNYLRKAANRKERNLQRCRDCTITFRNCKSFLPKRNCRRTASFDPARRQLTIRNNQLKGLPYQLENLGGFTGFPAKVFGPGSDREKYIFAALVVPKSWLEPEFCT